MVIWLWCRARHFTSQCHNHCCELPAIKLTSHLVASFSDGNWNLAPTPKLGTMHCVSASFFVVAFPIESFFFIVLSAVTSKCEKTRLEALAKGPLLGQFIPHCKEDGSFEPAQCWASTGYCWCVDENGEKRNGTTVRFEQPNC